MLVMKLLKFIAKVTYEKLHSSSHELYETLIRHVPKGEAGGAHAPLDF